MNEPVIVWSRHVVMTLLAALPLGYGSILLSFISRNAFLGTGELARSALYNLPALLVVGLPVGVGFATLSLFMHYGSHLPERARLAILVIAGLLSGLSFYMANEVVPQANRGIPVVFELYRTPGLMFEDTRFRRRQEMTTQELANAIRDLQARGTNARSYQLTYHLRFALPALTFAWCIFGIALGYLLSLTLSSADYKFCAFISLAIVAALSLATYFFWTATRPPFSLSPAGVAWFPCAACLVAAGIAYFFYYYEEELAT